MALLSIGSGGLLLRYLRKRYRQTKPYLDKLAAGVLLLLFSPVIALCALLIKLTSRGTAFYGQARVGLHGRPFMLIKLRTMEQDAEAASGPVWAINDDKDPRVTPVGRFLRRTHLDELPQLINVLRGEMSLIGPRPERPYFVNQLREAIPDYDRRLSIRPGITGLAQIRAGYDTTVRDVRRKVKLDLLYIRRMCWGVDFIVFIQTLLKVFGIDTERRSMAGEDKVKAA